MSGAGAGGPTGPGSTRPAGTDGPGRLSVLVGPGAPAELDLGDAQALARWYDHPLPAGAGCAVRSNMVATVDGAAAVDGLSVGIGTPADKAVFRVLRGLADAVLVGAGTARDEGYGPVAAPAALASLRAERGQRPAPVVVQVTRSGHPHAGRGMFDRPGAALVVTGRSDGATVDRLRALAGDDAVVPAPTADGSGDVDLDLVLAELRRRGLPRVLCEGGPTLLAALLHRGLVDEVCLTTTPFSSVADAPRVVAGGPGDAAPRPLRLHGLAVSDSTVLARWRPDRPRHRDRRD